MVTPERCKLFASHCVVRNAFRNIVRFATIFAANIKLKFDIKIFRVWLTTPVATLWRVH